MRGPRSALDLDLDRLAALLRFEKAVRWSVWGSTGGLGAALALALAARAWPILAPRLQLTLSLSLIGLCGLIPFGIGALIPLAPIHVARESDARLRLRARLATAVEIQAGLPAPAEIAARQLEDARRAIATAHPEETFRARITGRQAGIAAGLALLLLAGLLVPNPQYAALARRAAEQEAVRAQVERLQALRQDIAEREGDLAAEDRAALLQEIDRAMEQLQSGDLSAVQALSQLAATEDALRELAPEGTEELERALAQAGSQAQQAAETRALGEALSAGETAQAARQMEVLADQIAAGGLDAEERERTAAQLAGMAEALADAAPELASELEQAARALSAGEPASAAENIRQAAGQVQQAGQELAAQRAAAQALAQVQEGRAEMARSASGAAGTGSDADSQGAGTTGSTTGTTAPDAPGSPSKAGAGRQAEITYEPIYALERLGGDEGAQVTLPGQGREGQLGKQTTDLATDPGQALVPYNQVYVEYEQQALRALEDTTIPRGIKEYVKLYFYSVDPGR